MKEAYNISINNKSGNERNSRLEKMASAALTSSIFVLFSQYIINDMLYRYWT